MHLTSSEELEMSKKETKQDKEDFIPAGIRILNLDFDSCLRHVDYNIENLLALHTAEEEVNPFDVLNNIVPVIANICKLVDKPARGREKDTFCISTHLESCHHEDTEKFTNELENIRGSDIYWVLKKARDETVAHIHSSHKRYEATQKELEKVARYLIEHEDRLNRLRNLVNKIRTLIHNIEMSIKKKNGIPSNVTHYTLSLIVPSDLKGDK